MIQIDSLKNESLKKLDAIKKENFYIKNEFERHLDKHDQLYREFMSVKNKLVQKDEENKSKDS